MSTLEVAGHAWAEENVRWLVRADHLQGKDGTLEAQGNQGAQDPLWEPRGADAYEPNERSEAGVNFI